MNATDLEPVFGSDSHPGAAELQAERDEMMRIAAVSALRRSNNGRSLDQQARRWALHWSSIKPLNRPLSSGEPKEIV